MDIEIELIEAKKTLKEEEHKLRCGIYHHPIDYIRSAQYAVTRYWRSKVEELENKIEMSKQKNIERFTVSIKEIIETNKRLQEIHSQDLSNIDFTDDDGNIIQINKSIIDEFIYTGLNISDFITTGFYKNDWL